MIWCGSLLTHIDEEGARNLLNFFYEHLSENGLCVFTTHGEYSFELIKSKRFTYGLADDAQQNVLNDYKSLGYGFANYKNSNGYGISIVSNKRINDLAESVGNWKQVLFKKRGWDTNQDVYSFCKSSGSL